jgi:hypothetical protein
MHLLPVKKFLHFDPCCSRSINRVRTQIAKGNGFVLYKIDRLIIDFQPNLLLIKLNLMNNMSTRDGTNKSHPKFRVKLNHEYLFKWEN